MAACVRKVKTARAATAVPIVHLSRRGARDIEHLGSAPDDAGLDVLKAAARYRLTAGKAGLDLGPGFAAAMPVAGGVARCRSRRRGGGIWRMP